MQQHVITIILLKLVIPRFPPAMDLYGRLVCG